VSYLAPVLQQTALPHLPSFGNAAVERATAVAPGDLEMHRPAFVLPSIE
jgi:hypothetical protein